MGPLDGIKPHIALSAVSNGRPLRVMGRRLAQALLCFASLVPSATTAFSEDQLTELTDLCARPHVSYQHMHRSFVDAGWEHLSGDARTHVLFDLATIRMFDQARNKYTLAVLDAFANPSVDMEPNPTDGAVVTWVVEEASLHQEIFSNIENQHDLIYLSRSQPRTAVRIYFTGSADTAWHQHCDIVAANVALASETMAAGLEDYRISEPSTYGFVERTQFDLPTHSLHPFAATPDATTIKVNARVVDAAIGDRLAVPFLLDMSLSIKEPTDPTPFEVPQ